MTFLARSASRWTIMTVDGGFADARRYCKYSSSQKLVYTLVEATGALIKKLSFVVSVTKKMAIATPLIQPNPLRKIAVAKKDTSK